MFEALIVARVVRLKRCDLSPRTTTLSDRHPADPWMSCRNCDEAAEKNCIFSLSLQRRSSQHGVARIRYSIRRILVAPLVKPLARRLTDNGIAALPLAQPQRCVFKVLCVGLHTTCVDSVGLLRSVIRDMLAVEMCSEVADHPVRLCRCRSYAILDKVLVTASLDVGMIMASRVFARTYVD